MASHTSDIGRFWPVNGRYDDRQRRLYSFTVELHQTYLKHLGPGPLAADVNRAVADAMRPYVSRMRFATAAEDWGVRAAVAKPNGLTQTVGMAVHDNGRHHDAPLRPGLAFALDRQLWIREERTCVRVEDTVIITAGGVENLTPQCPLELDAVEALMRTGPGLLKQCPPTAWAGYGSACRSLRRTGRRIGSAGARLP